MRYPVFESSGTILCDSILECTTISDDDSINTCDIWMYIDVSSSSLVIGTCDECKDFTGASVFDITIDLYISSFDYDRSRTISLWRSIDTQGSVLTV